MEALAWLDRVFDALLSFFPHRVIVRSTHRGVKWSLFRRPRELKPGFRLYWPLITDIEIVPVARQTLPLSAQSLTTRDGKSVAASGIVVYSISDIVKAIGKENYDVDDTIGEISKAAIFSVVTKWSFDELLEDAAGIEKELTDECRKRLRLYGVRVYRAALTDFTYGRTLFHMGMPEHSGAN